MCPGRSYSDGQALAIRSHCKYIACFLSLKCEYWPFHCLKGNQNLELLQCVRLAAVCIWLGSLMVNREGLWPSGQDAATTVELRQLHSFSKSWPSKCIWASLICDNCVLQTYLFYLGRNSFKAPDEIFLTYIIWLFLRP